MFRAINNSTVNYDYADNDDYDPLDKCEVNSQLSNVNLEINEAWEDAIHKQIESNVNIRQSTTILSDNVLFNLE